MSRILSIVLFTVTGALAYQLCGRYDNYACGNYQFENCVWNPISDWTQCVSGECDGTNGFLVTYNIGGVRQDVQSYPNVCYGPDRRPPTGFPYLVSQRRPTYVSCEVDLMPTHGVWNCSFDIWTARSAYAGDGDRQLEIMIWINYSDNFVPNPTVPKVTIEGREWVTTRMTMFTWKYLSFRAVPRFTSFEALNLSEFVKYAMEIGDANPNHYVSLVQFGFEINGGDGQAHVANYEIWQDATSANPETIRPIGVDETAAGTAPYTVVSTASSASRHTTGLTAAGRNWVFDVTGRALVVRPSAGISSGVYLVPAPQK